MQALNSQRLSGRPTNKIRYILPAVSKHTIFCVLKAARRVHLWRSIFIKIIGAISFIQDESGKERDTYTT